MQTAIGLVAAALFVLPHAEAQLTKNDRAEVEKSIPPTVYLRIDLPCVYGKQGLIASWVEPMVEVSPTGVTVSQDEGWRGSVWTGTKRNMFWGFGPNDSLKYNSVEFAKDGTITVYFVGLGPKQLKKNQEAAVKLVSVKTIDDFKAAFNVAFSKAPLQDEHPEWPEEIRKAVGEHVVLAGMSKEQVTCVVGKPVDIEAGEEGGAKTEIWHIRQEKGVWSGWLSNKATKTGEVSRVTFLDGKVTKIDTDAEPGKKKK